MDKYWRTGGEDPVKIREIDAEFELSDTERKQYMHDVVEANQELPKGIIKSFIKNSTDMCEYMGVHDRDGTYFEIRLSKVKSEHGELLITNVVEGNKGADSKELGWFRKNYKKLMTAHTNMMGIRLYGSITGWLWKQPNKDMIMGKVGKSISAWKEKQKNN